MSSPSPRYPHQNPLLVNNFCFSFFIININILLLLLLLLPSTAATTGDLSSDRQALLDFAAAVPHPLTRKLNWNTNSSLCATWTGVTCSNNNATRVVALRLPAAGFYGTIPPNTLGRLDALSSLSLRSNRLYGSLPPDILALPSIRYLYFQDNNFSGDIPSNLSPQLNFLDLSFNSLTGDIPIAINNLTNLVGLNLQNNSLTGPIPDLLTISTLQQLNLSNNNFNGSIPHSLQRFPASSFQGNSLLCGSPLRQCPSPVSPSPSPSPSPAPAPAPTPALLPAPSPFFKQSPPTLPSSQPPVASLHKASSKSKLTTGSTVAIVVASSVVLFLLFLLYRMLCRTKKKGESQDAIGTSNKTTFGVGGMRNVKSKEEFGRKGVLEDENNELVFSQGVSTRDSFDLDHLLAAKAEVLGKGTYGTTYKAILQDGTTLAVKRLKQVVVGKMAFQQHMENVERVNHHPNIAPLRAYYYSKDEKLLVYDYAPLGNLSTLLHGNRALDWKSRLKVCLGAARGIAHIHSVAGGRLIHGNVKSSNVILTQNLNGCLSDFGITSLVGLYTTPSRRTGYQAPEVTELGKYTQKSDVYSFGVVLLEMLTGRAPIQSAGLLDEVIDLPRWVHSVVREEWTAEVFDTELMKHQNREEEMVQMLQVALACVARLPETRPKIDQVVSNIQEILQPDVVEKYTS